MARTRRRRMKIAKSLLRELLELDIPDSKNEDFYFTEAQDWREWYQKAKDARTPARMRAAIHYSIQSLYDALVDQQVDPENRDDVMRIFASFIERGKNYLTDLYRSEFRLLPFKRGLRKLEQKLDLLNEIPYKPKERFMEAPGLGPKDIGAFFVNYLQHLIYDKQQLPDLVVGCASSSLEIALPLAEMLRAPLYLVRFSGSREDVEALMLPEHQASLERRCRDSYSVVIEDAVLTGRSLAGVMRKITEYAPASVEGTSVKGHESAGRNLHPVIERENFHLYNLKGEDNGRPS